MHDGSGEVPDPALGPAPKKAAAATPIVRFFSPRLVERVMLILESRSPVIDAPE